MKKKSIEEKPFKVIGPKFIRATELRSIKKISKLVEEHGAIYISVEDGAPLKITRINLQ